MMKALSIIIGLVGYTLAIKVWAIIKMMKLKVENMNEEEIKNILDEILKDPKYRKYLR